MKESGDFINSVLGGKELTGFDSVEFLLVGNPEVLDSLKEGWGGVDSTFDPSVREVDLNVVDVDSKDAGDLDSGSKVRVGLSNVVVDVGLSSREELISGDSKGGLEV